MLKNFCHSLINVLLSDLTALKWLLGWLGIIFAFGLVFANSHPGAYDLMLSVADQKAWAAAFFAYGILKLRSSMANSSMYSSLSSAFLGFWLWCYTLVSFTSNPVRPIGSADIMIIVVVICEVWIAASAVSEWWSE